MSAASSVSVEASQAAITRAVAAKTAVRSPRQPSPGQQTPAGPKLAPSPELSYNQKRSPEAPRTARPASPQPIALVATDAEKKQPARKNPTNAAGPTGLAGRVANATVHVDGPRLFEPYPIERSNPDSPLRHDHTGAKFTVDIDFAGDKYSTLEYRQYVFARAWQSVNHAPWALMLNQGTLTPHGESYVEDGFLSGRAKGHRNDPPHPRDFYEDDKYHNTDIPGVSDVKHTVDTDAATTNARVVFVARFLLKVIDTSDGDQVVWSHFLSIEFSAEFDKARAPSVTNGMNLEWNDEIVGQR
jgi:hypothetical protein